MDVPGFSFSVGPFSSSSVKTDGRVRHSPGLASEINQTLNYSRLTKCNSKLVSLGSKVVEMASPVTFVLLSLIRRGGEAGG